MSLREKLKNWMIAKAGTRAAAWWLSLFSFTESSFFPIPPDLLLIAILLAKQERRWFFYSMLTALTSVLGGLFGYLIGFAFFAAFGQKIVALYNLEEEFLLIADLFEQNAFFAILMAAFTPIPYKIFTIAAGLFEINFLTFVLASLVGRVARYVGEGALLFFFGPPLARLLYRYFNIFSVLLIIIIGLLLYLVF